MKNRFEWIAVDQMDCMHCGACVGSCPRNAMYLNDLTVTALENCNGCGICIKICPVSAIEGVSREG